MPACKHPNKIKTGGPNDYDRSPQFWIEKGLKLNGQQKANQLLRVRVWSWHCPDCNTQWNQYRILL